MTGFLRDFGGKRSAGLVGPSHDPELAEMEAVLAADEADTANALVPQLREIRAELVVHEHGEVPRCGLESVHILHKEHKRLVKNASQS